MGRLRAAMRALVLTLADPAGVLSRLDDLVETIEDAQFATCVCVILDPAANTLVYASAGHPPTALLEPEGDVVLLEDVHGPPLGLRGPRPRRNARRRIDVGSRLVMYTDGLVERRSEPLDEGLNRLVHAVAETRHTPVDRLPEVILGLLFADYEQRDDVAMICTELISESPTRFRRCLDSDAAELRTARRALMHWVVPTPAAESEPAGAASDVVLAVSEALANAVEHGQGGARSIDLDVTRQGEQLRAVVRDRGPWRDPNGDPTRGRGLRIMRRVAEHVEVDAGDDGTTVTLTLALEDRP
jgi:anti-sigma regulatory factor (Ser/Thr protein kinase)